MLGGRDRRFAAGRNAFYVEELNMRHWIFVVLVLVTVSVAHAAKVKTATGLIRASNAH